jgi:hypothetical protein
MTPNMTTPAEELVLSRILATISQDGYRYVGIIASDVRDKIFLASVIRDYCPDVQLFTTEGDLMLAHPDYSDYLRGTVIASSYPLVSRNQLRSFTYGGGARRLQFSNQSDEGIYNAALALLGYYDKLLDYGPPFLSVDDQAGLHALEPGKADDKPPRLEPSVWLSVVGRYGLYPIPYQARPPTEVGPGAARGGQRLHGALPQPLLPAAQADLPGRAWRPRDDRAAAGRVHGDPLRQALPEVPGGLAGGRPWGLCPQTPGV